MRTCLPQGAPSEALRGRLRRPPHRLPGRGGVRGGSICATAWSYVPGPSPTTVYKVCPLSTTSPSAKRSVPLRVNVFGRGLPLFFVRAAIDVIVPLLCTRLMNTRVAKRVYFGENVFVTYVWMDIVSKYANRYISYRTYQYRVVCVRASIVYSYSKDRCCAERV